MEQIKSRVENNVPTFAFPTQRFIVGTIIARGFAGT